jgi:murein DD-endopeptidase MepM/ murein hydrolase activator NlpD
MTCDRMVLSALSLAVLMSGTGTVLAQNEVPVPGAQDKGFAFANTVDKAAAGGSVSGFSAQQTGPGQAINGSFQVSGTLLSMVRVHVGGADQMAACYLDLSKTAGSKNFSFNGTGWTPENDRSCASALPANGGSGTVFFKLEVRDKAQAFVESPQWRGVPYAGKALTPPPPNKPQVLKFSVQEPPADQAITGTLDVSGAVRTLRVHATKSATGPSACYTDLRPAAGAQSFSFPGNWQPNPSSAVSCASLLPQPGGQSLILFKAEVVGTDGAQVLVNGAAPQVAATYKVSSRVDKPQVLNFSVQDPPVDQPINGSLNVSGAVRMLRVHATKSTTGPSACYTDLRPVAGAQSFSFAGNWQPNPSSPVLCASLLPQPGGQSLIFFKAEVVGTDGVQVLANGAAPQVGATYKMSSQVKPIKVSGVSPQQVSLDCPGTQPKAVTFTVAGSNLPPSLVIDVPGALCRNDAKPSANQVTCEVNASSASVIVKDKPQAQGGGQIASYPLVVQKPVCAGPPSGGLTGFSPDPLEKWKEWQSGNAQVNTPQLRDGNVYKLSPAEIIYFAAKDNDMNPLLLLAKLQHEKSLIGTNFTDSGALKVALDHATGYGSFDSNPLNPKWFGFYPQVVGTAYEFGSGMRQKNAFEKVLSEYASDPLGPQKFKTVYAQYAPVMNSIAGTNHSPTPTGWTYATDFRSITPQHIQAFLDRYPGHLRNAGLFAGSGAIGGRVTDGSVVTHPLASLYVTQGFGWYLGPYKGINYNGYHPGTDFRGAPGTPVKAIADGEVTRVASAIPGNPGALGWYTIIKHPTLNVRSVYVHTAQPQVAVGQQVKAGQQIAVLTKPAWVPSHLHLEVQRGDSRVLDSKGGPVPFVGRYTTPKGNRGYVIKPEDLNAVWLDPLKFISGGGALAKGDATLAVMPAVVQEPLDLTTHNFVMSPQTDDPELSNQVTREQVLNQVMALGVSKGLAKDASMVEAQRLGIFQGATLARPTEAASRMEMALMVQRLVQGANLPQVAQGNRFTVEEFGSTPEASEQDYMGVTNRLYQWGIINGQQDHLGDWRYYPTRKASAFELGEVVKRLEQTVPFKQAVVNPPIEVANPPVDMVTPPSVTAVSISVSNPTPAVGELVQVNLDGTLAKGPVDIYLYLKVEQLGGAIAWYYDRSLHDDQGERKPWRAGVTGPGLPETNPIFQYTTRVPGNYVVGVLVVPSGSPVNMLNAVETSFTVR